MQKKCKFFGECGGCDLLNVDYDKQLLDKAKYLSDLMQANGIDVAVEKTIGLYYPYVYRNKIHLAVGESRGKTFVGFYKKDSKKINRKS